MNRNSVSRPRRSAPPLSSFRLPHPSWREAISGNGQSAAHINTATDFWDRIGL